MRTSRTLALTWLLTATLMATLTGCSSTVLRTDGDLRNEVEELKGRVLELQRKAAVGEVEMARLREQVAELEGRQRSAAGGTTPSRAGSRRTAEVPEQASAADLVEEAPQVPEELIEVAEIVEPVAVTVAAPARGGVVPSEPLPPAGQALYDRGYTLFHQGQYLDAEASFQRFVESYPSSELADNAEYWIGECRYARQDYRGALAAFRRTVTRYPEGNKVADALLKAGQTLEELGDVAAARQSYLELQRRFPETAAAVVAGERLASL